MQDIEAEFSVGGGEEDQVKGQTPWMIYAWLTFFTHNFQTSHLSKD